MAKISLFTVYFFHIPRMIKTSYYKAAGRVATEKVHTKLV